MFASTSCAICNKVFSLNEIREHVAVEHNFKKNDCSICGKRQQSPSHLQYCRRQVMHNSLKFSEDLQGHFKDVFIRFAKENNLCKSTKPASQNLKLTLEKRDRKIKRLKKQIAEMRAAQEQLQDKNDRLVFEVACIKSKLYHEQHKTEISLSLLDDLFSSKNLIE